MARSSKQTRKSGKSKSIFEQDRYTAELSTSQLVTGVCILLMFGLACFLLGVLIGRVDPTINQREAAASPEVEEPLIDNRVRTTMRPAERESVTAPPPELRIPPNTAKSPAKSSNAASGASPAPDSAQPRQPKPVSISNASTDDASADDAPESTPGAEELPEEKVSKPPVETPKSEPIKVAAKIEKTSPLPTPKQPVGPLPKEFDSQYGVQIGVFSSRESAEKVKTTIETKSSYRARIISSPDNTRFNVIVGDYADWATADRAKQDLRKNYGFNDCFPTLLD